MNILDSTLVRTPVPVQGESLSGFLLRINKENAYSKPSQIFSFAGIKKRMPELAQIALLFGWEVDKFSPLTSYPLDHSKKGGKWRFYDHIIDTIHIRRSESKVCVECLLESPAAKGLWDLRTYLACPKHRRLLTSKCPSCQRSLSQNRTGVLDCLCGHNFSGHREIVVKDQGILDIVALITAKTLGEPLDTKVFRERGYPIVELEEISLNALLALSIKLSRRRLYELHSAIRVVDWDIQAIFDGLHVFNQVLSGWPKGFYNYLNNLQIGGNHSGTLHFQKQFGQFHRMVFKAGLPAKDTAFIERAFIDFGKFEWNKISFIDKRITERLGEPQRYVCVSGLAKHLGVNVHTATKYVNNGLIKGIQCKEKGQFSILFDLEAIEYQASNGQIFNLREAAYFLKLPVQVLKWLKFINIYKTRFMAVGLDAFSEEDLVRFRSETLAKIDSTISFDFDKHVGIKKIMNSNKMGQSRYPFLQAFWEGKIIPAGKTGESLDEIIFLQSDLDEFKQSFNKN